MVGAESFQIIWVIGVRPNLITWVVVFFFFFFFCCFTSHVNSYGHCGTVMGGWCFAVRPNLITWVVGVSLCGRGRKNIICQKKKERVLSNLAKMRRKA